MEVSNKTKQKFIQQRSGGVTLPQHSVLMVQDSKIDNFIAIVYHIF